MATEHRQHSVKENHYRHLLIMGVLSFASMYVLMYAMVDALENVPGIGTIHGFCAIRSQ